MDGYMRIQIDAREHELIPRIQQLVETLPAFKGLLVETAALPIADIVLQKDGKDWVVMERKSIADLAASIKDGRYEEQSYRLQGLPIHNHNILYLIEGNVLQQGHNSFKDRIDKFTLYSAMFSLGFYKGFSVFRTFSLDETALFVCNCANKLRKEETRVAFYGETNHETADYVSVVKKVKKENITPDNIGEIMLSQIPGISSVTATAIMAHYKSIVALIESCKQPDPGLKDVTYTNEKGQSKKLNKTCIQNIVRYLVKPEEAASASE